MPTEETLVTPCSYAGAIAAPDALLHRPRGLLRPTRTMPALVLLSVLGGSQILASMEEESGTLFDLAEMVSKIISLVQTEQTAIEAVECYCLALVSEQCSGGLYPEFEAFIRHFIQLAHAIVNSMKHHDLYQSGQLNYHFDRMYGGNVFIRTKASYYDQLKAELKDIR